jgi:glyoxylase-like metal-dependent hydrolase (beta-lactamase superfamily II)
MVGHVTAPAAALLAALPAWVTLVRAPNPGPMTLDGTNTWVLRGPGAAHGIVVDPGPLDEGHLTTVAGHGPFALVLITHGHPDHVDGLHRLVSLLGGLPVVSAGSAEESPSVAGLDIEFLRTPGHTSDSVSFVVGVGSERAVLTGDTILGRGTTVVAWPDGDLGAYLDSLRTLADLGPLPVLPGHGPALADCAAAATYYLRHRLARLDQVRAARAAGARTATDVVHAVYADVDPVLWPAAELSVRAQLAYLDTRTGESLDTRTGESLDTRIRESIAPPAELDRP